MNPVWIEIENSRIYIKSDVGDKDRCRSVPGSRWDKTKGQWHVALTWASCRILRTTFGDRLEIGPTLLEWAKKEVETRIAPSVALRDALSVPDPGDLHPDLYSFQQAGAQFLVTAKHALLGDPMGAGKTVQVLAAAKLVNALPMLVICPNSMKRTWRREANKWWPGTPVYVVEGTAAKRAKMLADAAKVPGIVVMNWESVRLHSRLAPYGSIALTEKEKLPKELNSIPFKAVVADEAHKMKDPRSKQTRAVWAAGHGPAVEYRWAMTGTPVTDKPDTLYPILHFLHPGEWPSKTAYVNRWCMSSLNPWGGMEIFGLKPDMAPEFFSIFDSRFRRMPKEIILPQLPPIVYEQRWVTMGTKQQKAYDAMVEHLCTPLEDGGMVIASNPISQLTRCTQYASAYLEETDDGIRMTDPSCKLDQLMEDLEDISEPVVVFAMSRQLIEMAARRLEKAGISHSVVKGGQTNDQRQNAIDDFQNGKVSVICVVTAAGGVGITLTKGRIAIFLQRSWSNVDQQQAIGRVHRIGSEVHESVVIIDYITQGTVEESQLAVLAGKGISLEEIIRDQATIRRLLKGET